MKKLNMHDYPESDLGIEPVLPDPVQQLVRKIHAGREEHILEWIARYGFTFQDVREGKCEIERIQQIGNFKDTLYVLKKDGKAIAAMSETASDVRNVRNGLTGVLTCDLKYTELTPEEGRIAYNFGGRP